MCEPEREESQFWEIAKNIWPVFRQYWVAAVFFLLGIILLFISLIFSYFDRPNKQSVVIEHSASESANLKPKTIKVDVEGAVTNRDTGILYGFALEVKFGFLYLIASDSYVRNILPG